MKAGTGLGEVHAWHRSEEFRQFLETVNANTPPELDLHLVLDNTSTLKTELIKRWAIKQPRVHLHFTPTSASWINSVECWLSLLSGEPVAAGRHACTLERVSVRESVEVLHEVVGQHVEVLGRTVRADVLLAVAPEGFHRVELRAGGR
mgnify:CR=1 FL=1